MPEYKSLIIIKNHNGYKRVQNAKSYCQRKKGALKSCISLTPCPPTNGPVRRSQREGQFEVV